LDIESYRGGHATDTEIWNKSGINKEKDKGKLMIETLPRENTMIILPMKEGGRWVTDETYALFLPIDRMSLSDMVKCSGEYKFSELGDKAGEITRDTYPDVYTAVGEKAYKAKIQSIGKPFKGETGDPLVSVEIWSDFRERLYRDRVSGMIIINKTIHDSIIDIYPDVDAHASERLKPVLFVKKGEEYNATNVIAMAMEIVTWTKEEWSYDNQNKVHESNGTDPTERESKG
jgi:hypothetical protein